MDNTEFNYKIIKSVHINAKKTYCKHALNVKHTHSKSPLWQYTLPLAVVVYGSWGDSDFIAETLCLECLSEKCDKLK